MNHQITRRLFTIVILLSITALTALGQKKSFENVLSVRLRNMRPIISKNEITGYFMFYKMDKVDRKTNAYLIRILDANLNEIASETLNEDKNVQLLEAAFNDEALMLKFMDASKKLVKLYIYDNSAKLKSSKTLPVTKWDIQMAAMTSNSEEIDNGTLQAGNGIGFFNYSMAENKKIGYQINFFDSNGGEKWIYKSNPTAKELESADFLFNTKQLLFNIISKRPSLLSNDVMQYLQAIDISTGKQKFEKSLEDDKFTYQIFSGYENEASGNVAVFGLYYEKDAKMAKAKSLGLFSGLLDDNGNYISKKYIMWTKDVSKYLPINAKGKIEDIGYLYFHNIVTTADKKIYAISETYKKTVSGLGVAATIAGSRSANLSRMVVEDLIIFEFEPDFTLANVKVYDKSKTTIELPGRGVSLTNPQMLANLIKAWGGFDYSFTQMSSDKSGFIVGYTDVDKEEGKRKLNFESIIHSDNKYSTDKLALETEATSMVVFPGKPGYIVLVEYFKKLKKLDFRLEKINY
jgi:hypothetical protein